jgi:hypothetical protein
MQRVSRRLIGGAMPPPLFACRRPTAMWYWIHGAICPLRYRARSARAYRA